MKTLVCFLLLVGSAMAQTVIDLSVPQGTTKTITKEMGVVRPLVSQSNIDGTLIVEAGARIEMTAGSGINLRWSGTIDFRGTEAEPINIYPVAGATWRGFTNSYRTSASRPRFWLSHTNISGASGTSSAIELTYCQLMLSEVTIATARTDSLGRALRGMQLFGGTTSTGIVLDCTGLVTNCTFIGSTTGVTDHGKSVVFDNCQAVDVVTPFTWQPTTTRLQTYHRFSVSR